MKLACLLLACSSGYLFGAPITVDTSAVKPGQIAVSATETSLSVSWTDATSHRWQASFSLDSSKPLISDITVDDKVVVEQATPVYRCATGRRKGGWDAFFDLPPAEPEGTRRFVQSFHPTSVVARTIGDRVEVSFNGMKLGIFDGTLRYIFYPASSLIQQVAVLSTNEPDTAYYYDAGLQMTSTEDRQPGGTMNSDITYYDEESNLRSIATPPYGSERHTILVHYRAVAAKTGAGSIAAFPAPHRYIFARDYTTNLGNIWYTSWFGQVSLGIQQPSDDNTGIYPWMNAPPGTEQEMGLFLLLGAGQPQDTLQHVLAYTHGDRYPHVDGFVTFAPHWHFAFTVQATANGKEWQPPFKAELESIGLDAVMPMDFHGDGHPRALTEIRLQELDQYYKACRAQSDSHFLIVPSEEADVILGGHWGLVFPKPVFWYMDRKQGEPFKSTDPNYGTVYRVHSTDEAWKMITDEGGYAYQTHPRTKGSTGYPDKILNTDYFRSARYLGTGWKAMPSDLSSPRLGERAFKVLDDLNNLGLHKIMIGEVDVFQIHKTDELYAHMNVNYIPMKRLSDFDHYGSLLDSVARGEGFISTGEILLPSFSIGQSDGDKLNIRARVSSTFPLRLAEVVWGDGTATHRETFDLQSTHEFDEHEYKWQVNAHGWTWARFAVWDIASDGAFTNPVWRAH
jgi:hypothetical protein